MKRLVVHIEDRVGPRGGEYWLLTLECGHIYGHSKPPFRIHRIFGDPSYAPKWKNCMACDAGAPPDTKAKGPPKRASRSCGSRGPRD